MGTTRVGSTHRFPPTAGLAGGLVFVLAVSTLSPVPIAAQEAPLLPHRVLSLAGDEGPAGLLPEDRGATGLWQRLQELTTTASLLHTTAHPDDEHTGMLTLMARGLGVRTALLTLNRGEGGANAVGPELFDDLGAIRTEELLRSGRLYGLDDLYFTTAVDYGFSKTLDEALATWEDERLLADMVRVIRINRPLVVVSRFHGSARDGHGHHQAAGVLTPRAVAAAADPTRFPEQIAREGLRPWTVLRLYRGGVRPGEPAHVEIDASAHSPWLGTSYRWLGSYAVSLQRSQTAGRMREGTGPAVYRYERLDEAGPPAPDGAPGADFFRGLDTSLPGIFSLTGEEPPPGITDRLAAAESGIRQATRALRVDDLTAVSPHLIRALGHLRAALAALSDAPEAAFMLRIEERQLEDAITAALGIRLSADLRPPPDAAQGEAPGVVVPGTAPDVYVSVTAASPAPVPVVSAWLEGGPGWRAEPSRGELGDVGAGRPLELAFSARLPGVLPPGKLYFARASLRDSHYEIADSADLHLPRRRPPLTAGVTYRVDDQDVSIRTPVRASRAEPPFGSIRERVEAAPALSVRLDPGTRMLPVGPGPAAVDVTAFLEAHVSDVLVGTLALEVPDGWSTEPPRIHFSLDGAGSRGSYGFRVTAPAVEAREYRVAAAAVAGGRTFRAGSRVLRHRDLETIRIHGPALTRVRGIKVAVPHGLAVGYVMGVGDEVPAAMEALGADVRLLGPDDLERGELSAYDVIVVGTRAYAVREDLVAHNGRLLDYARDGGNLVVLYQTQEFVPDRSAPLPGSLPPGAEEVTEEDAPVLLLALEHPALRIPNRLSDADFQGWVEQRGSKFFETWDPGYTPLVETRDTGQEPQRGVWLFAEVGAGRYTYVALALHRQLPFLVPGAYRILANLLAGGRSP